MRFSTMSLTGIITLSAGILAAPSAVPDASPNIEALAEDRRAPVSSAYAFTSNLYDEIKSHTAAINATTTHLTASSTLAQKRKATASVGKQLKAMTAAIRGATNQINALTAAEKRDLSQVDANVSSDALEKRQAGPAQLAQLVANIILEISGALNGIIGHLGLGALLGFLNPLLLALSGLLLSLEVVVDNLLALVRALLDGLLTGLVVGLAGLLL